MASDAELSREADSGTKPQLLRLLAIGVAAFLILVARRPEAIFRSEFSFESGSVFYAGTYFGNVPEILLRPYAGYQHLLLRLISFAERIVPVELAPLVSHIIVLALIAGLAAFIASDRLRTVVPSRAGRIGLAILLIVLPNVQESAGGVGGVLWYVPIYLLALSLAAAPKGPWARRLELGFLCIISLTGPAAALMQPLFWWRSWRKRDSYSRCMVLVLAMGAVVQLATLTLDGRRPSNLGDPLDLLRVWLFRTVVGGFLGQTMSYDAVTAGLPLAVGIMVTVLLGLLLLRVWWRALPATPRAYVAYTWLIFAVTPILAQTEGVALLSNPGAANRYFLVPTAMTAIVVFAGFAWLRRPPDRWLAVVLTVALAIGIGGDLRLLAFPEQGWAAKSTCIGGPDPCVVPVYEPGDWSIVWPGKNGNWVQPRPGG